MPSTGANDLQVIINIIILISLAELVNKKLQNTAIHNDSGNYTSFIKEKDKFKVKLEVLMLSQLL